MLPLQRVGQVKKALLSGERNSPMRKKEKGPVVEILIKNQRTQKRNKKQTQGDIDRRQWGDQNAQGGGGTKHGVVCT